MLLISGVREIFSFLVNFGVCHLFPMQGNVVNITESKEAEVLSHCLQYSLCYFTFEMWEIAIFLQRSKAMVLHTILSCFPVIIQSGRSMPLVLSEELLKGDNCLRIILQCSLFSYFCKLETIVLG